ncbi:MAG: hypothetical protein NVS3B20_20630 [Polyangiales bacterium]
MKSRKDMRAVTPFERLAPHATRARNQTRLLFPSLAVIVVACACSYDKAYRQSAVAPALPVCALTEVRCRSNVLEACETGVDGQAGWAPKDDCASRGLACASPTLGCKVCAPGTNTCGGDLKNRTDACRPDGSGYDPGATCMGEGKACRQGICDDLCAVARRQKSDVGCEYWAVHHDNARISASLNATAQQYAVVVSNPQLDVAANIVIDQDDANPGEKAIVRTVAKARVTPIASRATCRSSPTSSIPSKT